MMRAVSRFIVFAAVAVACCASPGGALAAADPLHELAARYAPVVRLSEQQEPYASGESFEPINVDAILGNDEVALRGPWSGANLVKVGPLAADLASGRYGYALDFPGDALSSSACSYEEWQRRIIAHGAPAVYAHVATESVKLDLQYWFFYVYNDFNNKHEGDWELIQLDFDAAKPAEATNAPVRRRIASTREPNAPSGARGSSSSSTGRTRSSIRRRARTPTTSRARSSSAAARRRASAATTRTSRGGN